MRNLRKDRDQLQRELSAHRTKTEKEDRIAVLLDRLVRMGVPKEKLQSAVDWLEEQKRR